MLQDAFEKLLQARFAPSEVRAIEGGADARSRWQALEDSGFLDLMVAEQQGGAGLSLHEAFPFFVALGRHAMALPAAQAIAARALAGEAAAGIVSLAPALVREPDGSLRAPVVPFGAIAERVLGREGGRLLLLDTREATRISAGVHGSLQATLAWDAGTRAAWTGDARTGFDATGAALHAALLAGAMQRAFELTRTYCNERVQFGRPIAKFQAVQHQLSVMAEHVVASSIAAEAAFASGATAPTLLAAAAAKCRASEAAPVVAAIAHAVHGAIGITEEYDLQLLTRRLHEWRVAHGSEAHWSLVLGEAALASDERLADLVRSF